MMYLISTRLKGAAEDYTAMTEAMKGIGPWSNRLGNTWIIETKASAKAIRDHLKPHIQMDRGDRIFVGQITPNWASSNMGAEFPEWIRRRDFGMQVVRKTETES